MVCTLEGLAEPQRPDCVQESRCPNAGTWYYWGDTVRLEWKDRTLQS